MKIEFKNDKSAKYTNKIYRIEAVKLGLEVDRPLKWWGCVFEHLVNKLSDVNFHFETLVLIFIRFIYF